MAVASIAGPRHGADWSRTGTHTESGAYSVKTWLELYAAHCHEHAEQIRAAAGI